MTKGAQTAWQESGTHGRQGMEFPLSRGWAIQITGIEVTRGASGDLTSR
jgi:hypothetical protein